MDTSKEYIKMCERSEIQKEWNPEKGDFIIAPNGLPEVVSYVQIDNGKIWLHWPERWLSIKERRIWLPRQDQLQEMMLKKDGSAYYLSTHDNAGCFAWMNKLMLKGFDYGHLGKELGAYPDGEQLWFAFVMKEKYNKIWNGKDWEKD